MEIRDLFVCTTGIASLSHPLPIKSAAPFKLNNELGKLQKKHSKIHIFDSYRTLCPLDKCKIYDKDNDMLYFMDKTHLSIEGAMSLKDDLEAFLINKIRLNKGN